MSYLIVIEYFHISAVIIYSRYARMTQEEMIINTKPRFLGPLKGTNKILEGQRAHFEVRVEPLNDSTMKVCKIFPLNFSKYN